jgi:site-specific recombinase XerC
MREIVGRWLCDGAGRWSPETLEKYGRALSDLLSWLREAHICELRQISTADLAAWLNGHPTWGPNQRHVAVYACKGFFRWAFGEASPAKALRSPRRKGSTPPQRRLNEAQVLRLIGAIDTSTPKGIRDLAIVLIMLDRGLRASEICNARIDRLDHERHELAVIVKGGRWSKRTFGDYTWAALLRWLDLRPCFARPGVMTVFVSLGGLVKGCPLTRSGLQTAFKVMARKADIAALSPHDLRRTFVGLSTEYGNSTKITQIGGDWESISELDTYARGLVIDDWRKYSPADRLMGLR